MHYLAFFIVLFFCGCGQPRYVDFFPYHDDGSPKPAVCFLPVQDAGGGEESVRYLDQAIRWEAMDRADLYFCERQEAQFVAQVELLQDTVVPYSGGLRNCFVAPTAHPTRFARYLQARITVKDVRCRPEKVLVYQLLDCSQVIPSRGENTVASIYERFVRDIEDTIEQYVLVGH